MKIIYVHGDEDYGANYFEEEYGLSSECLARAAADIEAQGGKMVVEDDEGSYIAEIKEFGDIDPDFIEFVKGEIQDYDNSKHVNFYPVV